MIIFGSINVSAQIMKQYCITTNITTLLNYTVTSTATSNNTNGNTGILALNLSSDTIRNFDNIDFYTEFSNDICYPKISLGHNHFGFQNMIKYIESVEKYKKSIPNLITEAFNIDSIQEKDSKTFVSILDDTNKFINKLDSNIPVVESNDFMKIWELNI